MININFNKNKNLLVLETDEPSTVCFLEAKQKKYEYIPYQKKWGYTEKTVKIYEPKRGRKPKTNSNTEIYEIGPGWAGYLLGVFKGKLSSENYDQVLKDVVYSELYREASFPELRDYQNSDVLFLLKYRRGLISVNTGYGDLKLNLDHKFKNLPHCVNYTTVKNWVKSVKAEMLIPR